MIINPEALSAPGRALITETPDGLDALIAAELKTAQTDRDLLVVMRDDSRMAAMADAIAFFSPNAAVLRLPAWDCLPYDRVSPNGEIEAERMDTLTRLASAVEAEREGKPRPRHVIVTTVNALLQRVPEREALAASRLALKVGARLETEALVDFLTHNGYVRTGTVMEPGEYAVRGGIVDLYPAGASDPVRLDFFGDEVEEIRNFDPLSQRSTSKLDQLVLKPVSEVLLTDEAIARFRTGYREHFGAVSGSDPLYEAVSAGRRHPGMEHWLPLFHPAMDTLLAYMPGATVLLDHLVEEARDERLALIQDYYDARVKAPSGPFAQKDAPYNPLPPEEVYLTAQEWDRLLAAHPVAGFYPFAHEKTEADGRTKVISAGGRRSRDFAPERKQPDTNLFDVVRDYLAEQRRGGKRVVIVCYSAGARDRLRMVLSDHGIENLAEVDGWPEAMAKPASTISLAVLGMATGFDVDRTLVLTEQDILGDRLSRKPRRRRRAENFIKDATTLSAGDLVVHADHGIGRYEGLETVEAGGAPHDCLLVTYDGGDRLFVPVEHIEVLSTYGAAEGPVQLDKLGGTSWQARKARTKKRLKDMAQSLIQIAAARQLKGAPRLSPPSGLYDEFCARFPYVETDDQLNAIEDVIDDLTSGRPMDRLVCGDVGFGKTEVALRAAFVAAMSGRQVAIVTPTTLLCHQHYQEFARRFEGFPVRIEELSRLVSAKRSSEVRKGLADGKVDIVIGTHALLAKSVEFKDLGLLIIDEEQHFGVKHKERLKNLRANVHVLTLTATPIPRTLQLALAGVKELSIIATPPVDRLAVRTFTMPFDPVVVREAILREHYRGGQTFFVCPRVEQLKEVEERLAELVPEVKMASAHGRMAASELEKVMQAFYDGAFDVLLSTNIIESGLDVPTANTIILYRADMLGLAQLYQLRGRVGRSKVRGYAYLMLPAGQMLSKTATKRLEVMQTLDALGAGFTLASHDLDIRGAGNLLGEEQSGHIKEVGLELYQQMLDEAIEAARSGEAGVMREAKWVPQINLGAAVLIPDSYVADLDVRLALYRRIGELADEHEIEAFAAELVDRFGTLPSEVEQLLQVVAIKRLCVTAGIDRIEAGPKGAVFGFHEDSFDNPEALVQFIAGQAGTVRLRPDHKLVVQRGWETAADRLKGVREIVRELVRMAGVAAAGADDAAVAGAS